MGLKTPARNGVCTRSRIRARVNTAIPKEADNTKKSKSSNKSRKIAQVSDDCQINLNAKQIHLSNNSPAIPERACTRSYTRAHINTAIPKKSDCAKKCKSSNTSGKSKKRKIALVSDDCQINLNTKQIHLSNNSPVIPERPSNYADNEAIGAPSSVIIRQDDADDDDVIYDRTTVFISDSVSDHCEINLNAKQIHLSNNSPVIPERPSNYADNEAIGAPSSVIIRQDNAEDDDVIYDQTIFLISDSVSDHCEINLNAKQIHLSNNSPVIPERPLNYDDNEAIGSYSSGIIRQDGDDVIYDQTIICRDESGNDDVIYDLTTYVIADDEAGYDSDVIYDGTFEATGRETATSAVSDIVINCVSDSESSLSNESVTDSVTEIPTTTCQKYCTDVSPNDLSIPSQISDVSSTSLQSINNISSETNPGCLVFKNKHFQRPRVNLKRLNENRSMNVAKALSNPPPPMFKRKFFQRRQNVFPNLRIKDRSNKRFKRDRNNSKKRATTVLLGKAFNKDPHIPKNLYNIRAREERKELLTNTCNSKKFDTIRPVYAKQSHANAFNSKSSSIRLPYGAHAKRSHPNTFNSKFSTIRPTESHDKGIHTNSLNVRNYNTVNRVKRMVIIDGSNVAFAHSSQKEFSVKGILICLDYFSQRGHEVKAVVPQVRLKHSKSTNRQLLEELNNNGKLIISPCKTLPNGYSLVSYDDRFILDLAIDHDAAIISNDNYRDLFHESAKYAKVIRSQVISFTFFKNSIWFPKDPYAASGPLLNEILRSG